MTMGDPAGVGPEVLLKSYKKAKGTQNLVAISDFSKIQYLAKRQGVRLKKINYVDVRGVIANFDFTSPSQCPPVVTTFNNND